MLKLTRRVQKLWRTSGQRRFATGQKARCPAACLAQEQGLCMVKLKGASQTGGIQ